MSAIPTRSVWCTLALAFSIGTSVAKPPEDFEAQFREAYDAKNVSRCEKILKAWGKKEPDNPDYYIAGANFYARRAADALNFNYSAPGKGEYVLTDPKTRKPVAGLTISADVVAYQRAIDLLKAANARFPLRLDIWLGLAQLYEAAGRPEEQLAILKALSEFVNSHPNGLLGTDGRPYPEPVRENLAHQYNNMAADAFNAGALKGGRQMLAIGELIVQGFPESVYGHNIVANYHAVFDGNLALAVENYQKALEIAPEDSLVWCNLGESLKRTGKTAEARAAFEKVVELNNDPTSVDIAKKQLELLAPK